MLNEIKKGVLAPCPVCGGENVDWNGYRYITLVCRNCGFEMYPEDEFASEEEYFHEWNNLTKIDSIIENQDTKIEYANERILSETKLIKECEKRKAHYNWMKENIDQGKRNLLA